MYILSFAEFVSSNDFSILLSREWNVLTKSVELGAYGQGIPVRNIVDFTWGTNSGIRTFPVLLFLDTIQKVFPGYWEYLYLAIVFFLPLILFLAAIRIIKKIDVFSVMGGFFYAFNSWITGRVFTGFWQLNIVYAFLPFLIIIPLKYLSIYKEKFSKKLLWICSYSLIVSIVTVAQPHFLIICGFFSIFQIISLLFTKKIAEIKSIAEFYLLSLLLILALNAYFLLPGIVYTERLFTAPDQYFSIASVIFNGRLTKLETALRFDPYKTYAQSLYEYIQLVPVVFAVILFSLKRKGRWIYFLCLCVFIFFSKGINDPFKDLSRWIYQNLFFMHYFRDPSRFFAGSILFVSLIIGSFKLKRRPNFLISFLIGLVFLELIIVTNIQYFQSDMLHVFNKVMVPDYYIQAQSFINTRLPGGGAMDGERLLTIPSTLNMKDYTWYKTKTPISSISVFDMLVPLKVPLANTNYYPDSYSSQLSDYLSAMFVNWYDYRQLLPLGVKYILVDKSTKYIKTADLALNSLLRNKEDYKLIYSNKYIYLFEIKKTVKTTSFKKPVFAIGKLDAIARLYSQGEDRPVIILNQSINSDIKDLGILKGQNLFIDSINPQLDLTSERLLKKYSVDILSAGWDFNKLFMNFEPYKMPYAQRSGELFTSSRSVSSQIKGKMEIPYNVKPGKYRVLLKALTQFENSSLKLKVGDITVSKVINTGVQLNWIDLGIIEARRSSDKIELIKEDKNFLAIDALLLVPEDRYVKEKSYVNYVINHMNVFIYPQNKIVDTQKNFKVSTVGEDKVVSNKPSKYLTYLYTYGDYWNSNDPTSVKFISDLYGMTFISKNRNIKEIDYFPNTVYKVSILVSFTSLILILGYIIFTIKPVRTIVKKVSGKLK